MYKSRRVVIESSDEGEWLENVADDSDGDGDKGISSDNSHEEHNLEKFSQRGTYKQDEAVALSQCSNLQRGFDESYETMSSPAVGTARRSTRSSSVCKTVNSKRSAALKHLKQQTRMQLSLLNDSEESDVSSCSDHHSNSNAIRGLKRKAAAFATEKRVKQVNRFIKLEKGSSSEDEGCIDDDLNDFIADTDDDESNSSSSSSSEEDLTQYWRFDQNRREIEKHSGTPHKRKKLACDESCSDDEELIFPSPPAAAFIIYLRHIADVILLHRDQSDVTGYPSHAIDKVEGLICTTRESLLGSGAWRAAFVTEMKCRPFYSVTQIHGSDGFRCDVCGRSSASSSCDSFRVCLYGPSYDSRQLWSNSDRWWRAVPSMVWNELNRQSDKICHDNKDDIVELSSECSDDEENATVSNSTPWWARRKELLREKESNWNVTSHCKKRTQLYHTLLHYKLRLLMKVQDRIATLTEEFMSADVIASDSSFVAAEFARFEALVSATNVRWGGSGDISSILTPDSATRKSIQSNSASGSRGKRLVQLTLNSIGKGSR